MNHIVGVGIFWIDFNLGCWRLTLKSVQFTLSHLIWTSVPRATFTSFSWSTDKISTIYIEQTELGDGFHNLMNK